MAGNHPDSEWCNVHLGDVTHEVTDRLGTSVTDAPVYGVDRVEGLTPSPKYQAADLARYKLVTPGMFAYNPMRLNIGSIGYCSTRHKPGVVSPDYVVVACRRDRIEPDYLYWLTKGASWGDWVEAAGVGSVRVRIYYRELKRMPVLLPKTGEQRAIVGVLSALDDKIAHNRHTAQALERLARAIFRSWFVDFEPIKAKAAGATSFPSMPQAVFDALPTRFVDSEIGPLPDGWVAKPLAGIATFLNGLALQKYPPRGDGNDLPVIKIAELRKGSTAGADLANGDVTEQYVIQDRDLLFSWSGTLEAEFWFGGKGALNQHLFKVTSSHFPSWLCLLWIRQHLPSFRQIASSKATTMGHIKREHLHEAKVAVPPAAFLRETKAIIGPLFDLQAALQIESHKLAVMRDYLLPKLLSGEVRVTVQQEA
jgi:type I restriction enzyme S subunit